MKTVTSKICMVGVLAASAVAGCQSTPNSSGRADDYVPTPALERKVPQFEEASAAIGAREDAQLVPAHFSGEALNSLGRQKLDLMLRDSEASPEITVFVVLPKAQSDNFDKYRDSVVAYLKDEGLGEAQIKVEQGPNHAVDYPAATGIRNEKALDVAAAANATASMGGGGTGATAK